VVAAALISDPDEVLVALPADHVIGDAVTFRVAVARGVALAVGGALVTFGATPTRPETGFGYIELGDSVDGAFRVTRFKEKPGAAEAESLAGDGRHLWNSGMFVFTAGGFLEEVERHSPGLLDGVRPALPPERSGRIVLGPGFADVVSISIDHAVMEKTDRAVVIPIDVGWSDVGSWQSVWELSERDGSGNVLVGDVTAIEVTGSYVLASSRKVAVAGVDDLVVVETPDAVLVVPRSRAQLVRRLAAGPERPD
jgi:mannose-1-phosphate guanylyltransferase/mannose-6-phosphate isomerase